jgi:hypothetical protein
LRARFARAAGPAGALAPPVAAEASNAPQAPVHVRAPMRTSEAIVFLKSIRI